MALSASSFLFYLNPRLSLAAYPLGRPVFTRDVTRRVFVGARQYVEVPAQQPVLEWTADQSDARRPMLSLEQSRTNSLLQSADFDQSPWNPASFDIVDHARPSVIVGQQASRLENTTATNASLSQSLGTSDGLNATLSAIIERIDPNRPESKINYWNSTDSVAIQTVYNWDTDTVSPSGNAVAGGREILAEQGPNGGKVVRIWVAGSHPSGKAISYFVYPHQQLQIGASILHHTQAELGGAVGPSSPIVTTTAAVTRLVEQMYYQGFKFDVQDMFMYLHGVFRGQVGTVDRLWAIGDANGSGTFLAQIIVNGAAPGQIAGNVNDDLNTWSTANTGYTPVYGERFEAIFQLDKTNARIRALAVKPDGTITKSGWLAVSFGSAPLNSDKVRLAHWMTTPADTATLHYGVMKVIKAADVAAPIDGSDDTALTRELRAAHLDPSGRFVNVPL